MTRLRSQAAEIPRHPVMSLSLGRQCGMRWSDTFPMRGRPRTAITLAAARFRLGEGRWLDSPGNGARAQEVGRIVRAEHGGPQPGALAHAGQIHVRAAKLTAAVHELPSNGRFVACKARDRTLLNQICRMPTDHKAGRRIEALFQRPVKRLSP